MQDWREIWQRELIEQPPADAFIAEYFGYEPPMAMTDTASEEEEEIVFDVSDCEV